MENRRHFMAPRRRGRGGRGAGVRRLLEPERVGRRRQGVTVIGTWGGDEQKAFKAMVKPWETQTGNTVKYTGTRDLNTVLTTGVASGVLPDLAGLPGPGQMAEFAKGGSLKPLDDVLDMATYKAETAPALVDARHGRRQARRRLHQGRRQGPDLVQPQAPRLRGGPAGDVGRPQDAGDRQQGRRQGDLVRRARVRRRLRLAGHRLDRGHRPAPGRPGQVQPVVGRARSSGLDPRSRPRSRPSATSSSDADGGSSTVLDHGLPGRRRPAVHDAARLRVPPPGELHHRPRRVQGRRRPGPTTTSSRSPTSTRSSPAPSRAPATCSACSTTPPAAKSLMKYLVTAQAQDIWVKIGGALSANKNATSYPDDISQAVGRSCCRTPRSSRSTRRT